MTFAIATGTIFVSRSVILVLLATGITGFLLTAIQVLPYSLLSQYHKDTLVSQEITGSVFLAFYGESFSEAVWEDIGKRLFETLKSALFIAACWRFLKLRSKSGDIDKFWQKYVQNPPKFEFGAKTENPGFSYTTNLYQFLTIRNITSGPNKGNNKIFK